jgi:curved DNA-binding protein CbpA
MASLAALQNRLAMIEEQSYYEILRLPSGAPLADVKAAFHDFALDVHPDRYVEAERSDAVVAAEIFKRGVEAYKALSNPKTRAAYDEGLLQGRLRYVEGRVAAPSPVQRTLTLEDIAVRPKAKQHALKADRFIAANRLEEARVALVNAIQEDHDNDNLKERLNALYRTIAASPLSLDVDLRPRGR